MKQIFIDNKPTTYYITEKGKLLNKKTNNWHKGTIRGGYLYYDLRINTKRISKAAHRLVAETFIPNPNKYEIVNHKDGNKLNNNIDNLEWCSYSDNINHAYDTGLKNRTNGKNKRAQYTSDIEKEVWKPYKDSIYMISNKGRIRNLKTNNILKGKKTSTGYIEWHLRINGQSLSKLAHRLVYETFYNTISDGLVINHIDGNKSNNQLENLEAVSASDNIRHAYYQLNSFNLKKVGKYDLEGVLLQVYSSCAEAARQNEGCFSNYISVACNKNKIYKNYLWKYIEEE